MNKNEEKVLLICPMFADVGSEALSAVPARQGARRMDAKKGKIVLQRGRTAPFCGRYSVRGWSWSARTLSENGPGKELFPERKLCLSTWTHPPCVFAEDLGQPGDEQFVGGTFGVCAKIAVPENGIPLDPCVLDGRADGTLHAFVVSNAQKTCKGRI